MDNWAEIGITNVGCKTESALSLAQGYEFSHTVLTQGQKGEWYTRSTWKTSTTFCALALVKLRKPTATGTGCVFFIYYSFSISAVLVLFQENWNMAGPWYLHFLTPNIFLAAVTGTVPTVTVQLGQDGGDGTYFLVLIKAQLWELCFFNVSSYQCFVVWCCCWWLSTNVESVWNSRESRLICRPGPLYLKGLCYFYCKVVS